MVSVRAKKSIYSIVERNSGISCNAIGELCGYSKRHVTRTIRQLEREERIRVTRARGKTNSYEVNK